VPEHTLERYLLGKLVMYPFTRNVVAGLLKADDFERADHRQLYLWVMGLPSGLADARSAESVPAELRDLFHDLHAERSKDPAAAEEHVKLEVQQAALRLKQRNLQCLHQDLLLLLAESGEQPQEAEEHVRQAISAVSAQLDQVNQAISRVNQAISRMS